MIFSSSCIAGKMKKSTLISYNSNNEISDVEQGARSKFWGVSGSEDRGGGDNTIQFINIGRVGDKIFKEYRQKIGGWRGG